VQQREADVAAITSTTVAVLNDVMHVQSHDDLLIKQRQRPFGFSALVQLQPVRFGSVLSSQCLRPG
jgi:hypothetical protein